METSSRASSRMPYTRLEPSDHRLDDSREDGTSCLTSHGQSNGDVGGDEAEVHEGLTASVDSSDTKLVLNNGSEDNAYNVLHTRHSYSPDRKPSHNSNSGHSSPSKSNQTHRQVKAKISVHVIIGILTGFILGLSISTWLRHSVLCGGSSSCCNLFFSSAFEDPNGRRSRAGKEDDRFPDPCSYEALGGAHRDPKKSLLFVGVMTANKYLNTRAPAVHSTWGTTIPGKMAFFSASTATSEFEIPLVGLKGVDDSYPPQKKSFMMLKYMHDHCLDKFEWFMRADDDVFIRGEKIETFLRSINSSKPHFIGQAGLGNKEEFGLLSLEYDENFCMGGPGMIFSRETLRRMVPNIKDCIKNLYSTHEDVEIGRCVRKHAGVPCTWSYEMQNFFYHNSSGMAAYTGDLRKKEVHRAITLHPVKQHKYQHHVLDHFYSLSIEEANFKIINLKRILRDLSIVLGEQTASTPDIDANHQGHAPSLMKWAPTNRHTVRDWDFLSRSIYSYKNLNPRRGLETDLRVAMDNILMQVMTMINENARQRGRTIDFKDILYGYSRVNPLHGADYVLDLLLVYRKHKGRKMTVPVRRHAYLQQTFSDLQFREEVRENIVDTPTTETPRSFLKRVQEKLFPVMEEDAPFEDLAEREEFTSSKTVHFIIPLAGRYQTLKRFMNNFEKVCLANGDNVKLAVILFKGPESDLHSADDIEQHIDELSIKYPTNDLRVIRASGPFSRGLGLEIGSNAYPRDALLFFCDVDMIFTAGFIDRIRRATKRNKQVFFPIVYSQYDPEWVYNSEDAQAESDFVQVPFQNMEDDESAGDSNLPKHLRNPYLISKNSGYWRQFGFGIAALYNSDFRQAGGFDTSIQGWGKEDVDLYGKFVESNFTIFRASDPGIVHVYHEIICDPNLPPNQLVMCLGTKSSSYASTHQMAAKVLQTKEILFSDEDHGAGLEGGEPGDIAVQDAAVLEQIKEDNANANAAPPAQG